MVDPVIAFSKPGELAVGIPAADQFDGHHLHLGIYIQYTIVVFLIRGAEDLLYRWNAVGSGRDIQPDANGAGEVVLVDDVAEAAQFNGLSTKQSGVGIGVITFQQFARVVEGLKDGTFAGAIGAEQQGDGSKRNADRGADALEIFDGDPSDAGLRVFQPLETILDLRDSSDQSTQF